MVEGERQRRGGETAETGVMFDGGRRRLAAREEGSGGGGGGGRGGDFGLISSPFSIN